MTTTVRSTRLDSGLFNISAFKSAIGTVARPNIWRAEILFGDGLFTTLGQTSDTILPNFSYRCERTTIPGRTISTVDDYGGGPSLKLAQDISYSDIEMTIICSTDMQERYIFETWMNVIVLPREYSGGGLINYYDNYALGNELVLEQYNEFGERILRYKLHDVYPIQISAMNLTWEENNTYQRFDVTMNYRSYTIDAPSAQNVSRYGQSSTSGGNLEEPDGTASGDEIEFGDSQELGDGGSSDGTTLFRDVL